MHDIHSKHTNYNFFTQGGLKVEITEQMCMYTCIYAVDQFTKITLLISTVTWSKIKYYTLL